MPLDGDVVGQANAAAYNKAMEDYEKLVAVWEAKSIALTPAEQAVMDTIDLLFQVVHVPDRMTLRVNLARAMANA